MTKNKYFQKSFDDPLRNRLLGRNPQFGKRWFKWFWGSLFCGKTTASY